MINTQLGSTHFFTNLSDQDVIHIRPGPGENLVLHGTLDPPPLTEASFPIEKEIEISNDYQISDIQEITPTDSHSWTNTGQCVRFNKAEYSLGIESKYKFIISSAQRDAANINEHSGGFRVYDRSNQQLESFPASVYNKPVVQLNSNRLTLRHCDIYGISAAGPLTWMNLSFNAYYQQIPLGDIIGEVFDIYEVKAVNNVDPVTTQRISRYNRGVSVFNWLKVEWGYDIRNSYGPSAPNISSSTAKIYGRPALASDAWTQRQDLGVNFISVALHGTTDSIIGVGEYFTALMGLTTDYELYLYNTDAGAYTISKTTIIDLNDYGGVADHHSPGFIACSVNNYFVHAMNTSAAPGGTVDNPTYGVGPEFTSKITVFDPEHNVLHQTDITGITIFGIALYLDRLAVLSTQGLTLYTIDSVGLRKQFTKPFDSSWIPSYDLVPNHSFLFQPYANWFDFPIDIFKDEILVGSQSTNKVFLLTIEQLSISALQSIRIHEDFNNSGITIDTNNLRIDSEKSMDIIIPTSTSTPIITFNNNDGLAGSIATNGLTTSYLTVSDYRIKYDIQTMTDGLLKIRELNPVYFKFKCKDCRDSLCSSEECACCDTHSNEVFDGFIAHQLQAIIPQAVTGIKDQLDDQDRPVYQSVDSSFVVASLVSAIKTLSTKVIDLTNRIEELELV